jgi:hypothetical protein
VRTPPETDDGYIVSLISEISVLPEKTLEPVEVSGPVKLGVDAVKELNVAGPVEFNGPLKLGVAAVSDPEKVDAPVEVNGPLNEGVAAVKEVRFPTDVKDELTIVEPSVVAVKTSSPSILYVCPDATLKLSSVFNTFAADLYRVVSAAAEPEDHLIFPPASITKFGVALLDGEISKAVSAAVENFRARILLKNIGMASTISFLIYK